jgi:hypothetical protein
MCGLCGVPAPVLHWSESPGRDEGAPNAASLAPVRAQRLRRVQCLDTVMRAYACTVSDWQGRAYQVATFTGKTALVDDLSEIWATVEKLTGRSPSPLDDAVLDRFDPACRRSIWVPVPAGYEGLEDQNEDGGYLGRRRLFPMRFGAAEARRVGTMGDTKGDTTDDAGANEASTAVANTLSLACAEAIDWTGFGCWLTMLLHAEGDRISGIHALLDVCDVPSPVLMRGHHRLINTPVRLGKWPGREVRSTLTLTGDLPAASCLAKSLGIFATVQKAL